MQKGGIKYAYIVGGEYWISKDVDKQLALNGITLNDPESQAVFWYNIPNLGGMAQSMQIQRGVGASNGGSPAFGAAINMQTLNAQNHPYGEADLGFGSLEAVVHAAHFFAQILDFGLGGGRGIVALGYHHATAERGGEQKAQGKEGDFPGGVFHGGGLYCFRSAHASGKRGRGGEFFGRGRGNVFALGRRAWLNAGKVPARGNFARSLE